MKGGMPPDPPLVMQAVSSTVTSTTMLVFVVKQNQEARSQNICVCSWEFFQLFCFFVPLCNFTKAPWNCQFFFFFFFAHNAIPMLKFLSYCGLIGLMVALQQLSKV